MRKNNNKEKNKNKKVHFDEENLTEKAKRTRPKSVEKQYNENEIGMNISTNTNNISSRLSTSSTQKKTSIEDFTLIQELGCFSYSKVILAKHNMNGKIYALKIIYKNVLDQLGKQYEVHIERQCLTQLRHSNILKLNKAFQDDNYIYFVLEYCRNLELFKLINCLGKFDYKLAQFYSAEILSAISYIHKEGIYHRDLKPENIVLDEYMHLKIFGFATADKVNRYFDLKTMRFIPLNNNTIPNFENEINNSNNENNNIVKIDKYNILLLSHLFIGTPEYVSPEVLEHNYSLIGPSVDIWAFGIMLYLFFTGYTPFKANTESEILENIKNVKYSFDNTDIPDDAKDLISKILIKDPTKRIGYNSKDYSEIKNHPFFKGINFEELEFEEPPLLPLKETLEKYGYDLSKLGEESKEDKKKRIKNNLDEEDKEIDFGENNNENNDVNNNNKLNNNNLEELKKDLKGKSVEHNLTNKEPNQEDVVLLENKLEKKSPWLHYNTRLVKFFSKGHIDYFDPKTNELKGSFIVNSDSQVNIIDEFRFEIVTVNRTYSFKSKERNITIDWTNKLNSFISKCAEKKKSK